MNFAASLLTPENYAWLVESLAHVLWQGTLIAGLAAIMTFTLRLCSPQKRYCVYCAGLLLTAACLPLNIWLLQPVDPIDQSAVEQDTSLANEATLIQPASDHASQDAFARSFPPGTFPVHPVTVPVTPSADTVRSQTLDSSQSFAWAYQWIVLAYVLGIGAMFVRLLMGLYGSQRLRTTARPLNEAKLQKVLTRIGKQLQLKVLPVVAYSARVATPLVVGVIKPTILLPTAILSQLTTKQVESLLLHEFAHIRRYDHWANLLQRIVETVLFFHPAVWWLNRKISFEREHCCDDLAIHWGSEPCDYAETLVRISEIRSHSGMLDKATSTTLAAKGNRPSHLQDRVLRVLGMPGSGPSVGLPRGGFVSLVVLAALLMTGPLLWQAQARSNVETAAKIEHPADEQTDTTVNAPPQSSLIVKLIDKDGKPIPNVKVQVYDGQSFWRGGLPHFKTEFAVTDSMGNAVLPKFFERMPAKADYWIQISRKEGVLWQPPNPLIGRGTNLTKLHAGNPLVETQEKADSFEITVTLIQECPTDIAIVDAITGKREHFAQLLFKDDRVNQWTVAALQDYIGDPGGDDADRLGLKFYTTLIAAMNDARFMATREGYYPVEFQLPEKLSPEKVVQKQVELKPASQIELTILDPTGAPAVGAKLEYIGPDVRGSYRPVKPSDDNGKMTLNYPELGELARWRITHSNGWADVEAKPLLEQDVPSAGPIKTRVRLIAFPPHIGKSGWPVKKPSVGVKNPPKDILWGNTVDGMRLGMRPSDDQKRKAGYRIGERMHYEVWIENLTNEMVFIPRDHRDAVGASRKGEVINLLGTEMYLSWSVPPEVTAAEELTLPPRTAAPLVLSKEISTLLVQQDAPR